MDSPRAADTFVVRVRREPRSGSGEPPVERWQVEHVQTGLKVYVRGMDDAFAVIRSSLSPRFPHRRPPRD